MEHHTTIWVTACKPALQAVQAAVQLVTIMTMYLPVIMAQAPEHQGRAIAAAIKATNIILEAEAVLEALAQMETTRLTAAQALPTQSLEPRIIGAAEAEALAIPSRAATAA